MKYAIMVLALVGVLARPTAAIADFTGNQMFKWCKESRDTCAMYAMGWRHSHMGAVFQAAWRKGARSWDAIIDQSKLYSVCFPLTPYVPAR